MFERRINQPISSHLLRLVHYLEDIEGERAELRFFRTRDGREVDFVVLRERRPWLAVEVKSQAGAVDKSLRYLLDRCAVQHAFQVHLHGTADTYAKTDGRVVRVLPLSRFLTMLP